MVQPENSIVFSAEGCLEALPPPGQLQAGYFRGLKTVVRNLGGDPQQVLERHNIDPFAFEDPDHHIACTAAVELLEYCSSTLHDSVFGLHLAEQQDPDVFGCATAIARAAPTLRQALQSLIDYVPVSASPECAMEMVVARDIAELRWRTHAGFGDTQQANFQGLLLMAKTLQMLGRQHFRPRYATLAFGVRRADILTLQDHVGCKIHTKTEANAVAFDADILDRPIATSNRMLFGLLGGYLAQLRAASRSDFVEQVEAYVRNALSESGCSVDGCAEKLGTSSRTLQKRLTRMGVKFSEIVQTERTRQAKHALLWSDRTLDEIAFQLGYSEQTSFGRAFKRSTGVTPQAFRATRNRKRGRAPGTTEAN
jgi:AraC-like DNA-binding protein